MNQTEMYLKIKKDPEAMWEIIQSAIQIDRENCTSYPAIADRKLVLDNPHWRLREAFSRLGIRTEKPTEPYKPILTFDMLE